MLFVFLLPLMLVNKDYHKDGNLLYWQSNTHREIFQNCYVTKQRQAVLSRWQITDFLLVTWKSNFDERVGKKDSTDFCWNGTDDRLVIHQFFVRCRHPPRYAEMRRISSTSSSSSQWR